MQIILLSFGDIHSGRSYFSSKKPCAATYSVAMAQIQLTVHSLLVAYFVILVIIAWPPSRAVFLLFIAPLVVSWSCLVLESGEFSWIGVVRSTGQGWLATIFSCTCLDIAVLWQYGLLVPAYIDHFTPYWVLYPQKTTLGNQFTFRHSLKAEAIECSEL